MGQKMWSKYNNMIFSRKKVDVDADTMHESESTSGKAF
jgi:hypothetical protein